LTIADIQTAPSNPIYRKICFMNVQAIRALRSKLKDNQIVQGIWITMDAPAITEIAVSLSLDYVVIDMEHGYLDMNDVVSHLRCTARSNTVALVRIPELQDHFIKRVLDIGADGFIAPGVDTPEKLRTAIEAARYAPRGSRGMGGDRATTWAQQLSSHVETANENVLIVPLLESVAAANHLEAMIELALQENVDLFQFGPADHCSSAGYAGQWDHPAVAREISEMITRLRTAGLLGGILATNPDDYHRRVDEGFQLIGLGLDSTLLIRQIQQFSNDVGVTSTIESPCTGKCHNEDASNNH